MWRLQGDGWKVFKEKIEQDVVRGIYLLSQRHGGVTVSTGSLKS